MFSVDAVDAVGGGGGLDAWAAVERRLVDLGMVDAAGCRRSCRLVAFEASNVIDHWQRVGAWPVAALHYRLANGVPGALPSDGWPPGGNGRVEDQAKAAKRDQQIREGRAFAIVKAGRKSKQDEAAIRATLAAEGLDWPGGES